MLYANIAAKIHFPTLLVSHAEHVKGNNKSITFLSEE